MKCARCGNDMAAPPCARCLLQEPLPPVTLGHFTLEEELGRGGMGVVYRGRDTRIDRPCAVKLLPPEHSETLRAQLQREAQTLAQLSHPNIVALYEAGEADGQRYLVMELVEGQALRALVGRLSESRAVDIAIDVCRALEAAHARGIVHRDVKPDNVLIDRDGKAKLSDFGIARLDGGPASGLTGAIVGTPRYLAPELSTGAAASAQSDVYALGIMLHELCTGVLPEGTPTPLRWPLDGVVRRATAQDPAHRFSSARALLDALLGARTAMAANALPPEELTWLRAVALLFAAASGVLLWTLLQSLSPVIVTPDHDVYPLVRMINRTLPDGRVVSYARLEIGLALLAVAAFALAAAAYGVLRRHWRQQGLEDPRPERPLKESRQLFWLGVVCMGVFVLRRAMVALGDSLVTLYFPVIGGSLELYVLYVLWTGLLEAARTSRALGKEPLLWIGFALALMPPAIELGTYVLSL